MPHATCHVPPQRSPVPLHGIITVDSDMLYVTGHGGSTAFVAPQQWPHHWQVPGGDGGGRRWVTVCCCCRSSGACWSAGGCEARGCGAVVAAAMRKAVRRRQLDAISPAIGTVGLAGGGGITRPGPPGGR